jgi:hypothetical protein
MRPVPLTTLAQSILAEHLRAGDLAIDATAGNGHDTEFLVKCVGSGGCVWAFDIQTQAIAATEHRLTQLRLTHSQEIEGGIGDVKLIQRSHAEMAEVLPQEVVGQVSAVMFNLGYLPGGDKAVTTVAAETLAALAISLDVLAPRGLMTVMLYPGHPVGEIETRAVLEWSETLGDAWRAEVMRSPESRPTSPVLLVVRRINPRPVFRERVARSAG